MSPISWKTHVPLSISVQLCCSYHKMADFLWNTFVKKGDAVLCDICHGLQAQMEIQRDVCGASHLEFYSSTLFYSRVFALLSIKTIYLFVCLFIYLLLQATQKHSRSAWEILNSWAGGETQDPLCIFYNQSAYQDSLSSDTFLFLGEDTC